MSDFNLTDVIDLLERATDNGVNVSFVDDKLLVKTSKEKEIDHAFLNELRFNKDNLINYFKKHKKSASESLMDKKVSTDRAKFAGRFPLSFNQERLWFIDQLEGSRQYHIPFVLHLKGKLNKEALNNAFRAIVNRHEVLRTVIDQSDGIAFQRVLDKEQWQLSIVEDEKYKAQGAVLKAFIKSLIDTPFDLSADHMLRAHLIVLKPNEYLLVVTVHHIAADEWSTGIIVNELVTLYDDYRNGRSAGLPALTIQYIDFSIWQREHLSAAVLNKKLDYWRKKLVDASALNLPADFTQTAVQNKSGKSSSFRLDNELSDSLSQLSQQQGATLFMTLLAAYKVLLYKYCNQTDISVGCSIAGRQLPEIKNLVGFFTNTLVLRDDLSNNPSFLSLLGQVKQTTLDAYDHQDVPFEKVVEATVRERDANRHPLFQVMFVLHNVPDGAELRLGDVELSEGEFEQSTAKFDISISISEGREGLKIGVSYREDLFRPGSIERMIRHYTQLLRSIVANPHQHIDQLQLLTAEEQQQLFAFNTSVNPYASGPELSFIDLFFKQVALSPEAIAVVFDNRTLTYKELDTYSNQLSNFLHKQGVSRNTLVPICMERSLEMIIGILGIMKAGAAYVPIERDHPAERIAYILEDTKGRVVLSSCACKDKIPAGSDIKIIALDEDWEVISKENTDRQKAIQPDQLVYVIYTSGSTGKPKGVMISHENLLDYLLGLKASVPVLAECRSFALISSIATDLGNTVLFGSLITGASLHVLSKELISDAQLLHAYFSAHKIDGIKIVPSHWKALSASALLLPEKIILFGGEALAQSVVEDIQASGTPCVIINHYGPTETTIGKLIYQVNEKEMAQQPIPIGKPFSSTYVYVLNSSFQQCPVGIPGELYIGGKGVGLGYWNNEELTQRSFIRDPFLPDNPGKLYRTGDVVKYLEDGNIAFIGRSDDQLKINGYRVEIGEIERILNQSEDVTQGIVIVKNKYNVEKQLIAYVIPEERLEKERIVAYLRKHLPEYMIPATIVEIDHFPLLANGKIDRKGLPDPETNTQNYQAPTTAVEEKMLGIWSSLLGIEGIGIHDDFFALGGHSLLAIRLISAIRKELEIEVAIGDVFDHPTIASLCKQLMHRTGAFQTPAITLTEQRPVRIPLSYSQERLWFIDQLEGSIHYHKPSVIRLKGELVLEALESAFQSIINRHEVLRTVIKQEADIPYQQVRPKDTWKMDLMNGYDNKTDPKSLQSAIQALIHQPFDLSTDHMLRAHVFVLNEHEHLLVITIHHIASDGWSNSIIIRELVELYNSYTEKRKPLLSNLSIQYADYAIWQRSYLTGSVLDGKLNYWRTKLSGLETLQLPADYRRPAIQSTKGASLLFKFDQELSENIRKLSQQHNATVFMTLLAAFNVLLYKYSGQDDICIGSAVAGRTQKEVEDLIGFFINTLAFRNNLSGDPSFISFLQQVKQTVLEAYAHQDTPFEKIVDTIVTERDVSRNPLFQVIFVLQNTPDEPDLKLQGLQLQGEELQQATAQLDLALYIHEQASGFSGNIVYCTDLYKEETISRMITHFEQLLKTIVHAPAIKINALNILTEGERHQLIDTFNKTAVPYDQNKTIIDLFIANVIQYPQATAIEFGAESLTYAQLHERSDQLAKYLYNCGVKPEMLITICLERSLEMIVGILGILKTGAAYVPIDPGYPSERINFIIQDTRATLMLCNSTTKAKISIDENSIRLIQLDTDDSYVSNSGTSGLITKIHPRNLAYVIYTSGSTGTPKGVMIEHRGVVNMVLGQSMALRLKPRLKALQFASFSFDASCYELFNALLTGGTLVLPKKEELLTAEAFEKLIADHQIELVTLPPSYLHQVKEKLACIKTIVSAGEPLNREDAEYVIQKGIRLINAYGPTENSVCTTLTDQPLKEQKMVVIGKPVANMKVYILNAHGGLCPTGIPGEICIGGNGLARGYLNRPELTAEKFIMHSLNKKTTEKLYRTGDVGRWLPDGDIEYIGRADDQVKIRGYRIEPAEIAHVLEQCDGVNQATVVLTKEIQQSNGMHTQDGTYTHNRLIAYVVPEGEFDETVIRTYLENKLPQYMIPASIIALEKLPVTINGKIDKKALQALSDPETKTDKHSAPRNETEEKLIRICREILDVEEIGMQDNFFRLGGDSILIIKLISSIRTAFDKQLILLDIYEADTLDKIAELIDKTPVVNDANRNRKELENELNTLRERHLNQIAEDELIEDIYPMSDIQNGMLYTSLINPGKAVYHNQIGCLLPKELNTELFEKALAMLVQKHPILRTVFNLEWDREGLQIVYKTISIKIHHLDLSEKTNEETDQTINTYLKNERSIPFQTGKEVMWRAALIHLKGNNAFLFQCHHAIFDGWSDATFLTELNNLYLKLKEDPSLPELPLLKCNYKDYVIERLLDKKNKTNRDWWENELSDYKRLDILSDEEDHQVFRKVYEEAYVKKLIQKVKAEGISLKGLFFGAFIYALSMLTDETEVTVGLVSSNRPVQEDGEHVLGCFLNTIPFRFSWDIGEITWKTYFSHIENKLIALKGKDGISLFELTKITGEQYLGQNPFFDVMFNFVNFHVYDTIKEEVLELGDTLSYGPANTPMVCNLNSTGNACTLSLTLGRKLSSGKSLQEIHQYMDAVLDCYVNKLNEPIDRAAIIPSAELQQLFASNKKVYFQEEKTIIDIFKSHVQASPEARAVIFEGKDLTYKQLDERSDQLSNYLREKGLKTGALVPLYLDRSFEMIIAIMAIIKAGSAYVPIDPEHPITRVNHIIADTNASLLISTQNHQPALTQLEKNIDIIWLDTEKKKILVYDKQAEITVLQSSLPVYAIYTSGTTGLPKAVLGTHRAIINLIVNQSRMYGIEKNERILLSSNYAFDASVEQLFFALLNGALLVIVPKEVQLDTALFGEFLERNKITHLEATASFLGTISPGKYGRLKRVISGGEICTRSLAERWKGLVDFYNIYGPTETTISAMIYRFLPETSGTSILPIGKPLANVHIYIVNEQDELVPFGVKGELYIGGVGVTGSYLNRSELTAEKFISNPFGHKEAPVLYRTGDIVNYLPDGNVMYIGRKDNQTKINGYRIELGEIENQLQQSGLVTQAVVITKPGIQEGDKILAAYVLPKGGFNKEKLRACLQDKLPEYMIPQLFIEIGEIPFTPNGKINKRALPDPDLKSLLTKEYIAPRNKTEELLAGIWEKLMGMERISMNDNFFEMKGHSLLAMRLVTEIRKVIHAGISIKDIFANPTIASLTQLLQERETMHSKGQEASFSKHIVALNNGCKDHPLFIMPGTIGICDNYHELASALTGAGVAYGLYMQGVFEKEEPLTSFAQIAAQNIAWVKQVQPQGPYRLIGHSFGGRIAFEMASQLEQLGEPVELVALIDTLAVSKLNKQQELEGEEALDFILNMLERYNIISKPYPEWVTTVRLQMKNVEPKNAVAFIADFIKVNADTEHAQFILRLFDVYKTNLKLDYTISSTVNAPVILVKSAEHQLKENRIGFDEYLGWSPFAPHIRLVTVPGTHASMIKEENAVLLANHLKAGLKKC